MNEKYYDIQGLADREGWMRCIANNTDTYGGACVQVAYNVMKELDRGEPFESADKLVMDADDVGGLTGFMAGAVANIVSKAHMRGDEFRRSWNKETQLGSEGDEANESGGVLNPAILNIK